MDLPTPDTIQCLYTNSGIPKIIHQTWKTSDIPEQWKTSTSEWKRLHPDWTYILWTDDMNDRYISKFYPEFIEIYRAYEYPIQRADFIRYIILYDFGGMYCDLDMFPKQNIEHVLTAKMNYFVFSSNNMICNYIQNCFMVSPRKSMIMKDIQTYIKNLIPQMAWSMSKHFTVINTTGSVMISNVLFEITKEPFVLLPRRLFNPFSIITQDYIIDKDKVSEAYIDTTSKDSTWNSSDTYVFNFIVRYKNVFATIGLLTIIILIVSIIYYFTQYRKCKSGCESYCVTGTIKGRNLVER